MATILPVNVTGPDGKTPFDPEKHPPFCPALSAVQIVAMDDGADRGIVGADGRGHGAPRIITHPMLAACVESRACAWWNENKAHPRGGRCGLAAGGALLTRSMELLPEIANEKDEDEVKDRPRA